MTKDQQTELINAAYRVVTSPSVAAYRGSGYDKKIGRGDMTRLLKALTPLLGPAALAEVLARLEAAAKADADIDAWRNAKTENDTARKAAEPFTATAEVELHTKF